MVQSLIKLPAPPGAKSRQHVAMGRSPHFLSSLVAAVIMLAGLLPSGLMAGEAADCHRDKEGEGLWAYEEWEYAPAESPWEEEPIDEYPDEEERGDPGSGEPSELKSHGCYTCTNGGWVYRNGQHVWVCFDSTHDHCSGHLDPDDQLIAIGVIAGAVAVDSLIQECSLKTGASGIAPFVLLALVLLAAMARRRARPS